MKLIFFADKLPPEIGGMETHAKYFIEYFATRSDLTIITKKDDCDCIVDCSFQAFKRIDLWQTLSLYRNQHCVVFYNSGRWIECFERIKETLQDALFFYRTGGNEILKAPLSLPIYSHKERQNYWIKTLNHNIDYLVANSEFTKKRLLDLGVNIELITIISGGIDVSKTNQAIANKEYARKKYNCTPVEKMIVCCCRFVEYKRPFFLLQAFNYLNTSCKIILAGDGPLLEGSQRLADSLGMKNVYFLGKVNHEESLQIIASADVYCQASTDLTVQVNGGQYIHTEGMGRSLIEAVCCGTKVVATNCGALHEFITPQNGALVDGDEKAFASAIEKSLRLPKISESVREFYLKMYDFTNIFVLYSNIWKREGYY